MHMSSPSEPPVFRFAPSPNGYLHLGHAYSAILNFQLAQARGGRFLLRIEDIDRGRCRLEFEQAIFEDLRWLGLTWEEPVLRQSDNLGAYSSALGKLAERGLLFPCTCSRGDIAKTVSLCPDWPKDPDLAPLYPGTCKTAALAGFDLGRTQSKASLRLDIDKALALITQPLSWQEQDLTGQKHEVVARPELWGDAVLARKDIATSYHIAVVIDDAASGVTDIVRGKDLYEATSLHRLLQVLLGLPEQIYHHHPLVLDANGKKLSKSNGSTALRLLRGEGLTPAEVYERLGLQFTPSETA
jgi:glutamyl-Q tRNA(Asp) synthetase